ncbi:flagellar FliJ family protein [Cryobacterium sp. CG_9.6]|uniref:flagellar FliJ family protein n=1 Tax=Cryobacterium sp. CG_9.6 TaxID=2760710 RepID=UPI0024739BD9|nr:flagellar FliJ family protein [Cryobacterium sp. CG_9.6]MDH6237275.1 flagellar FliJ protein [Cryobacterium sp. CG_9.6]
MIRLFPLAGLLRLRHLEQDEAAGHLAAANSRVQDNDSRRDRARALLHGTADSPTTAAALQAMAAARSSSRSMLADLDALGQGHRESLRSAQSAFDAARAESKALEKLEARHAQAVAAADLHAEQIVLDEIASTRWHRNRTEDEQ